MTLVLVGKGLVLGGSTTKIEDKQVPGIYIERERERDFCLSVIRIQVTNQYDGMSFQGFVQVFHLMVLMVHFCVFEWIFPKKTFDKAETSTKLMALLLQQGVEKIDRLRHRENGGGGCDLYIFPGAMHEKTTRRISKDGIFPPEI